MKPLIHTTALVLRAIGVCIAFVVLFAASLIGWRGLALLIVVGALLAALWPYVEFEAALGWPHRMGL